MMRGYNYVAAAVAAVLLALLIYGWITHCPGTASYVHCNASERHMRNLH